MILVPQATSRIFFPEETLALSRIRFIISGFLRIFASQFAAALLKKTITFSLNKINPPVVSNNPIIKKKQKRVKKFIYLKFKRQNRNSNI